MNFFHALRFTALLLIVLVFLSGCKKKDKASSTTTVNVRLSSNPDGFNPLVNKASASEDVGLRIFMSLLEYDSKSLELVPFVAKSRPEISDIIEGRFKGGKAYTFEILEEAQWDKAHPVLALDYLFTVKSALNPALSSPYAKYLAVIDSVSIDSKNPKKFTVYSIGNYFKVEAFIGSFELLPAFNFEGQEFLNDFTIGELKNPSLTKDSIKLSLLTKAADAFRDPKYSHDPKFIIGCGPYLIDTWAHNQFVKLIKKKDWWGDKLALRRPELRAYPDVINYLPIVDDAAALAALNGGDIDILPNVPLEMFYRIQEDDKAKHKFNFLTPKQDTYSFLPMNMKDDVLKNKRVRMALSHIIDLDGLIEKYAFGNARRLSSVVLPGRSFYNEKLPLIKHDLKRAGELLDEAGWKDTNNDGMRDKLIKGVRENLSLTLDIKKGSQRGIDYGTHLKNEAKKVGVDIILNPTDKYVENYRSGNYQLSFLAKRMPPGLPDFSSAWLKAYSYVGFGDKVSDAVIKKLSGTLDNHTRDSLYRDIQARIYNEYPMIFMYVIDGAIIVSSKFKETPISLKRPGYIPQFFR